VLHFAEQHFISPSEVFLSVEDSFLFPYKVLHFAEQYFLSPSEVFRFVELDFLFPSEVKEKLRLSE
jgi:hypothetical protein